MTRSNDLPNRFLTFLLVAIFLIVVTGAAHAQDREKGSIFFTFKGEADLQDTLSSTLTPIQIDANINFPLYIGDATIFLSGLRFNATRFDFTNLEPDELDLYGVILPFTIIHRPDPKWSLMGNLTPGLYSDFEKIDSDDLRLFALFIATREMNERWQLAFGAVYAQVYGESRVFPAIGAIWTINERWTLDLIFPTPKLVYTPAERLRLFVGTEPAGNMWNLQILDDELDLELKGIHVGVGLEWKLKGSMWLHASAGADLGRHLTIEGSGISLLDSDAETGPYLKIGLIWR